MSLPIKMSPSDTCLLVIDVQEKLMTKIQDADRLVKNIAFLVDAAHIAEMKIQATEQYPKGLGHTVQELASRLSQRPEKVEFSCCAIPEVVRNLRSHGHTKVVLAGIESHVCVLQTGLDLLAENFHIFLPVDAIGSRFPVDHDIALRRMENAGAILTTTETCVFEWIGGAHHPQFKQISLLVQDRMKDLIEENQ